MPTSGRHPGASAGRSFEEDGYCTVTLVKSWYQLWAG
jgi:hypothetical protein